MFGGVQFYRTECWSAKPMRYEAIQGVTRRYLTILRTGKSTNVLNINDSIKD